MPLAHSVQTTIPILHERGMPLSFPADIWALACTIFAILGQRPLFKTWFPSDDQVIDEQVDTLGKP